MYVMSVYTLIWKPEFGPRYQLIIWQIQLKVMVILSSWRAPIFHLDRHLYYTGLPVLHGYLYYVVPGQISIPFRNCPLCNLVSTLTESATSWGYFTILVLLFYFYRNAVSLERHLGETEMEEWRSTQGTLVDLSRKELITEKHDRSTQTEHLLIESLATPERQAKRLPPIQHRISTDHWWVQCAISHWRTQYWRIIFEYTCCWKYPS